MQMEYVNCGLDVFHVRLNTPSLNRMPGDGPIQMPDRLFESKYQARRFRSEIFGMIEVFVYEGCEDSWVQHRAMNACRIPELQPCFE